MKKHDYKVNINSIILSFFWGVFVLNTPLFAQQINNNRLSSVNSYLKSVDTSLPQSVDHSKSVCFPPVANQGYIGSCDWFAVVYYQMTFMFNNLYGRAADSSNIFSPRFGYNVTNNGASYPYNIRVDDVYKFVQKHGSATIKQFPYNLEYRSWCTNAELWEKALRYRIVGYQYFTYMHRSYNANYSFDTLSDYLKEIKTTLSNGELLVIQTNNFEKTYFKGIKDDTSISEDDEFVGELAIYQGNNGYDHTMAIVGYNDNIWVDVNDDNVVQESEKGAIKIVDSFGPEAANHNEGFYWMLYSTIESSIAECRINRMFIRTNYEPKILCKITLHTLFRDKVKFQLGRAVSTSVSELSTDTHQIFDPYAMGYGVGTAGLSLISGASCSYDGSDSPSDGNFVFDLTEIFQEDDSKYWYLKVINTGSEPLLIKKFQIINKQNNTFVEDLILPLEVVNKEEVRFLNLKNASSIKYSVSPKVSFNLYPIPTSDEIIVNISGIFSPSLIEIIDSYGKPVFSSQIISSNQQILKVNNLSPGIYFYCVKQSCGTILQSGKMTKL